MVGNVRNVPLKDGWSVKVRRSEKEYQSFFVTNFPEHADVPALWKVFDGYGYLIDVYIAKKRAKSGKRFGFIRFMGVKHVLDMENRLADVWMGSFHFYVEASKFDSTKTTKSLTERVTHVVDVDEDKVPKASNVAPKIIKNPEKTKVDLADENSYASRVSVKKQPVLQTTIEDSDLISISNKDYVVMAKVKDVGALYSVYKVCLAEGFSNFDIQYVGGYWIWFKFETLVSVSAFKTNDNILSLFYCIKEPSDNFTVDERIVWIEISGLPTCAWGTNASKKLASLFGRFLFFESNSKLPLSSSRVCIATYDKKPILSNVTIGIKGISVEVYAHEVGTWMFDIESTIDPVSSNDVSTNIDDIISSSSDSSDIEED
ncbi:uncharacterized protein [Rutidosis leptorrhynchoides]|uniref:uncharacterized protein n=1 Tax=Rutidosis leptorrhynchoides TaxID=125765 RepID=UPI003A9987A2